MAFLKTLTRPANVLVNVAGTMDNSGLVMVNSITDGTLPAPTVSDAREGQNEAHMGGGRRGKGLRAMQAAAAAVGPS